MRIFAKSPAKSPAPPAPRAATGPVQDPPFLDPEPPPWAARGFAWLLLSLFGVAVLAALIVRVPETIAGRFILVPVQGADPVRALRRGQVTAVHTEEGAAVAAGATLFVLRSEPVGDRAAELGTLRAQLAGADDAERNARTEYEARRAADAEAADALRARVASLARAIEIKRGQHRLAAQAVERYRTGYQGGTVSEDELTARQLEEGRLAEELETATNDRAQAAASLETLRHERAARDAAWHEQARGLAETRETARIRAAALEREVGGTRGSDLAVAAPCAGSVLRLAVRSAGAVVQEGETLAEVACAHRALQAELTVPSLGVARMREGQRVKLLYDAFPFQRYGTRTGVVRWVSPAGASPVASGASGAAGAASAAPEFRALVAVRDTSVRVDGVPRALLAGMGGEARVVVGRRTLASYAFEPIRQLRESLADAEAP